MRLADLPRPWRRRSLRARLTMLASALLALGLVAGAAALVAALTHSLGDAVNNSARRTAEEVAGLVNTGQPLPDPLPVGDGSTVVVQVVDDQGHVLAASAGADHLVPLLREPELAAVRAGRTLGLPGDRAGVGGSLRVLGLEAGLATNPQTVVVAVDASQIGESSRVLRTVLLVGFPVLLVLLAALSWYVVGRALRPVEDLRQGAEDISGTGGSRRLPVPPSEDEVHRLAVTLNRMLGRLDAASMRQRAFVADAAHELRSPLASLRTQLEVAQHLGDRAQWPRTARGALLDVARLSQLVDDLLLLAQLDERGPASRLSRGRVDMAALVDESVARYNGAGGADAASAQGVGADGPSANGAAAPVKVTATGSGGPAVVEGDAGALRRVLANLVDNAVRHAVSQVCVSTAREGETIVLTVTDDGPGIPAADRERVFDRFTRLDGARSRDAGGAGLGLPITRELVRAHGGTVTLEDAAPGLRAAVRLPSLGTS